eukprot:2617910-Amphidinium_carterae.1
MKGTWLDIRSVSEQLDTLFQLSVADFALSAVVGLMDLACLVNFFPTASAPLVVSFLAVTYVADTIVELFILTSFQGGLSELVDDIYTNACLDNDALLSLAEIEALFEDSRRYALSGVLLTLSALALKLWDM